MALQEGVGKLSVRMRRHGLPFLFGALSLSLGASPSRDLEISVFPDPPRRGELAVFIVDADGEDLGKGTATIEAPDRTLTCAVQSVAEGRGFSFKVKAGGEHKIRVEVAVGEGRKLSKEIAFTPAPKEEEEIRLEGDPPARSDQQAAMREIARHWSEVREKLETGRASSGGWKTHIAPIRRLQESLPGFQPPLFADTKEEFRGLAKKFGEDLKRLEEEGDPERARELSRRIDSFSCTRCHLKFRWGRFADVSRFPELRDE